MSSYCLPNQSFRRRFQGLVSVSGSVSRSLLTLRASALKSASNLWIPLRASSICSLEKSSFEFVAKACAVLKAFLISRPFRSMAPSSSRQLASTQLRFAPGYVFVMNNFHSWPRAVIERGEYLMARWMRDLKAVSKAPIRLVVRKRIPS